MRPNVSFSDDPSDAVRRAELVCDTFARFDHRRLGFTTAVLRARRDMLAERTGVRRLGFLDLGTTTGPVELPAITTLVADSARSIRSTCSPPICSPLRNR
jgi:hypothetical protein